MNNPNECINEHIFHPDCSPDHHHMYANNTLPRLQPQPSPSEGIVLQKRALLDGVSVPAYTVARRVSHENALFAEENGAIVEDRSDRSDGVGIAAPSPPPLVNNDNNAANSAPSSTGSRGTAHGRRGDPRMHRAVAARLAQPKTTLLDALLSGGFVFPGLGEPGASDRTVRDKEGVLLYQRKNQLNRRLRLAKKKKTTKSKDAAAEDGGFEKEQRRRVRTMTTAKRCASPSSTARPVQKSLEQLQREDVMAGDVLASETQNQHQQHAMKDADVFSREFCPPEPQLMSTAGHQQHRHYEYHHQQQQQYHQHHHPQAKAKLQGCEGDQGAIRRDSFYDFFLSLPDNIDDAGMLDDGYVEKFLEDEIGVGGEAAASGRSQQKRRASLSSWCSADYSHAFGAPASMPSADGWRKAVHAIPI